MGLDYDNISKTRLITRIPQHSLSMRRYGINFQTRSMEFNPYRKITHPPAKTLIEHIIKISLTITEISSGLEHYPPADKSFKIFQKILKTSIKVEKIIDEVKLIELKS